jgi:hypothetical protein
MWAPALSRLGQLLKFRLIAIAKPACGTFVDPGYLGPDFTVSPICREFVNWSIGRINHLHPNVVVVASTTGKILRPGANPNALLPNGRLPNSSMIDVSPARTAADFRSFVRAIGPSGAHVVLMGDIPIANTTQLHGLTPTQCLLVHPSNIQQCSLIAPTFKNSEWDRAMVAAADVTHVPLINVHGLACAVGHCPAVVNKLLVHFDALHLTRQYILYTSGALEEMLRPYLPVA